MTEIVIKIEAPELSDAIDRLTETIAAATPAREVQPVANSEIKEQVMNPPEAASESAASEILRAAAPAEPEPVAVPEKEYTLDDLSIASADLIDRGKMGDIMKIIEKYGVPAINLLPKEKYADYAADIRAIGGNI